MRSAGLSALAVVLATTATTAFAQEDAAPKDFAAYEEKYQYVCNGPLESFAPADKKEFGGYLYEHSGATVKLSRAAPQERKGPVRIGVLSAIKDAEPETLALLDRFFADFEKRDVDFIVVGGDTAEDPAALDKVYAYLAKKTQRPLLSVPGNSERPGAHNYAILQQRQAGALNLLNTNVVRRVDFAGVDVVSLGGYYNKQFLHMAGACIYKPEDVEAVIAAAKQSDDPVLLLMHGPPQQKGKDAIDFVPGDGNVGDPEVTRAIKEGHIAFGIHGHILEAGAKATDLGGKLLKPGKLYPSLFLNPGSANPLPWKLNSGGTSYGLAAIVTIDGKKAQYEVLRAPKPQ